MFELKYLYCNNLYEYFISNSVKKIANDKYAMGGPITKKNSSISIFINCQNVEQFVGTLNNEDQKLPPKI